MDEDRDVATVTLRAGPMAATFVPDAGMVGTALRHRGEDLVDLPGGLARYVGGKVTGLPLVAPWANRLSGWSYAVGGVAVDLRGLPLTTDERGLPVHGAITGRHRWDVTATGPDRLAARFDAGADPGVMAAFPFPHVLAVEVVLAEDGLAFATTLAATGDRPVPVAFGYHPYLRLPGVARADVVVALPARRHLALDARGVPTGAADDAGPEAAPLGGRTFDDLYALRDDPADRRLSVAGGGRRVTVEVGDGYRYAQVFAPPAFAHVCLEPMTAATNALVDGGYQTVAPGESFTARFRVLVEDGPW